MCLSDIHPDVRPQELYKAKFFRESSRLGLLSRPLLGDASSNHLDNRVFIVLSGFLFLPSPVYERSGRRFLNCSKEPHPQSLEREMGHFIAAYGQKVIPPFYHFFCQNCMVPAWEGLHFAFTSGILQHGLWAVVIPQKRKRCYVASFGGEGTLGDRGCGSI